MTKSRANWHAIVALGVVVGAECSSLKDETWNQITQHGPFFWVCLVCAILVGFGNSILSTKTTSSDENQPASPVPPAPGAAP